MIWEFCLLMMVAGIEGQDNVTGINASTMEIESIPPFELRTVHGLTIGRPVQDMVPLPDGSLALAEEFVIWKVNLVAHPTQTHLAGNAMWRNRYDLYGTRNYSMPIYTVNRSLENANGSDLLFGHIWGLLVKNRTHMLVSDKGNDCLRLVNLETTWTTRFAGRCHERPGFENGHRLQGKFYNQVGIIQHKNKIYVADRRNHAIRFIEGDTLGTFMVGQQNCKYPTYFALIDARMYVTKYRNVMVIDLETNETTDLVESFSGPLYRRYSLSFRAPRGIIAPTKDMLVVDDFHANQLQVIHLNNMTVETICIGRKRYPSVPNCSFAIDGDKQTCGFGITQQIRIYGQEALIGDCFQVRRFSLRSIRGDNYREVENYVTLPPVIRVERNVDPQTAGARKKQRIILLGITAGAILILVILIVIGVAYKKKSIQNRRTIGSEQVQGLELDLAERPSRLPHVESYNTYASIDTDYNYESIKGSENQVNAQANDDADSGVYPIYTRQRTLTSISDSLYSYISNDDKSRNNNANTDLEQRSERGVYAFYTQSRSTDIITESHLNEEFDTLSSPAQFSI